MLMVCIEAEAGSRDKHVYDQKTLKHEGARRISHPYPYPYGFIVGTCAADGDNVDCYLITGENVKAGAIVECEPIGLLEQYEDEEVDHKVLATLPGQHVELGDELLKELRDFIYAIFAQFPEVRVNVGPILPREAALHYIREHRET